MDLHLFMTIYHFEGKLLLLLVLLLLLLWMILVGWLQNVEYWVQQVANLSLANITFTHNTNPLKPFHVWAKLSRSLSLLFSYIK